MKNLRATETKSTKEHAKLKLQALQAAINKGIASGDGGVLDMESIKALARTRAGMV